MDASHPGFGWIFPSDVVQLVAVSPGSKPQIQACFSSCQALIKIRSDQALTRPPGCLTARDAKLGHCFSCGKLVGWVAVNWWGCHFSPMDDTFFPRLQLARNLWGIFWHCLRIHGRLLPELVLWRLPKWWFFFSFSLQMLSLVLGYSCNYNGCIIEKMIGVINHHL